MRASFGFSSISSRWAPALLLSGLLCGGSSLAGDEGAMSPHLASFDRAEALQQVHAKAGVTFVDLYAEW